jgi:hypothetical protein
MSDAKMVWDESNKVNAGTAQGQQSLMVEMDMLAWKANTPWPKGTTLKDIIHAYAESRGWNQSPVDGFQLVY